MWKIWIILRTEIFQTKQCIMLKNPASVKDPKYKIDQRNRVQNVH